MLHEWLSNEIWLSPQIDFLVWIQNIRLSLGPVFDGIFIEITKLGELFIPTLFMCIIYWCIDSKAGIYLFLLNAIGLWIAKIFKMIACIYRPWILSDRIHPALAAFKMSQGYSFPSGHTLMGVTTWGGVAFLVRNRKFWCSILVFTVLLIGFSRIYLGVHTPQDVIFSIISGGLLVFAVHYLLEWCNENKNRYLYLLPFINIIGIASLLYVIFKSYPQDYIDGKLLVDPKGAIYISVLYTGWILGILNGAFLSKRFLDFDAKLGSIKSKITRGIIGVIILSILFGVFDKYFFSGPRDFVLSFVIMFVIGLFITYGYPFFVQKLLKK